MSKFSLETKLDPIVESVTKQFNERSQIGQEKYHTTLADNDKDDFLEHLKQELMDSVLYIAKLQQNALDEETKMVKFGNYLLSDERSKRTSQENQQGVTMEDLENYK